jgi:BolA protein
MSNNDDRTQLIKAKLQTAFTTTYLEVVDDSHKHVGHQGTHEGGGHFVVTIVSPQFNDQPLIQRHRLVYAAVNELMNTVIHALSIQAQTPEEFAERNK